MLSEQFQSDLHDAMRAGDDRRKSALRMLLSAIHYAEIQAGHELDDEAVTGVLSREVKTRRESIEEFRKGHRDDLVAKEESELAILSAYLPAQMSRDDIVAAARDVIAQVGASGPGDKNKVMPVIIRELRGKADGSEINAVVTELLAQI